MAEALAPPHPTLLALIARDLAIEAGTLEQVLAKYSVDQDYFDAAIAPNELYKTIHADYIKQWQSLDSTQRRVAFYALTALEEHLPTLANRMGSTTEDLADAIGAAKLFRDLAGIAPPAPAAERGSGQQFSISINFGDHAVKLDAVKPGEKLVKHKPLEIEHDKSKDRSI